MDNTNLLSDLFPVVQNASYQMLGFQLNTSKNFDEILPFSSQDQHIPHSRNISVSFEAISESDDLVQTQWGTVHAKNGDNNNMNLDCGAQSPHIYTKVLGIGLGMLMLQRGELAISGTSLVYNVASDFPKGLVLCGEMGVGKTTLSAYFRHFGYPWMGDNIAALHLENLTAESRSNALYYQYPEYPQQELTTEAYSFLAPVLKDLPVPTERIGNKLILSFWKGFWTEPVALRTIVILKVADVSEVTIIELTGLEKSSVIVEQLVYKKLLDASQYCSGILSQIETLAKQVRVYIVTRPTEGNHLDEVRQIIECNLVE